MPKKVYISLKRVPSRALLRSLVKKRNDTCHGVALGADGRVWTWGHGSQWQQLGHDEENTSLPVQLADSQCVRRITLLDIPAQDGFWTY